MDELTDRGRKQTAYYHLPGLFEFYGFYSVFLPIFRSHRDYFYDWCEIGSIYGAPAGCIWGGGRTGSGNADPVDVLSLVREYGISARLTFSNSLLRDEHLSDRKCNDLCRLFEATAPFLPVGVSSSSDGGGAQAACRNGVIIHSDLLLKYLTEKYPGLYLVSSTTKVQTSFQEFRQELERKEFQFAVPDFRLNRSLDQLVALPEPLKAKVEFLCNECCWFGCTERKLCYENVSRKNLGEECADHVCRAPGGNEGYRFSRAMENPGFIGIDQIQKEYMPAGFSNFKIEGRELGSAILLEFILYYMTKPECQLKVREEIFLDAMLDLF